MRRRDLAPVGTHAPRRGADRAVGRAPAEDERVRAVGIVDGELRDVGRDTGDLRSAEPHHPVVVLRVVRDVAGLVLLLEPADPVLEARRSRDRPRPRERLGVALVREEPGRRRSAPSRTSSRSSGSVATSGISHGSEPFARYASESRKTGVRYFTAIRAASIAASKQPDGVEAATTGTGRLRVPAEEDHQQVGLLGLRRHARRRPGALDVDDERAAARASLRARPSPTSARCPAPQTWSRRARRRRRRRARRPMRRSRPRPGTSGRRSASAARAARGRPTPA